MPEENKTAHKILVVDDDLDTIGLVRTILELYEYKVFFAIDGRQALGQMKEIMPDLIIADINMPNVNGWQLAQQIRETEGFKKIPVILLSGLVQADSAPNPNEVGDFYMAKPFEPENLVAKVRELLNR